MQNPFTTTFSKTPENIYIHIDKTDEILDSRQGYISLALLYFAEYVKEYC